MARNDIEEPGGEVPSPPDLTDPSTGAAEAGVPPAEAPSTSPEFLIDPEVSRAKFAREISEYRQMEREYIRRGWFLIRAEYPEVVVAFAAPHVMLRPVFLAVSVDFTNYDLWAPSVRFVDPFTLQPLLRHELPTLLPKRTRPQAAPPQVVVRVADDASEAEHNQPGAAPEPGAVDEAPPALVNVPISITPPQPLVIAHSDEVPFLCIAGVREYHSHPFHSNDPWLAHRGTGVGRLYHILDVIWRHGVLPLRGYDVAITGLQIGAPLVDFNLIPE